MKNFVAIILISMFLSQAAMAQFLPPFEPYKITPSLSGSWYNPSQSGHGLSVEVLDDETTLIYWYVYHPDGSPMFLVAPAQIDGGKASGIAYYHSGMRFGDFDPNDLKQEEWGQITLQMNGCNSAELDYSANDPEFGRGSIDMVRLTSIEGAKCERSALEGTYNIVMIDDDGIRNGTLLIPNFSNIGNISFSADGEPGLVTGGGMINNQGGGTVEIRFDLYLDDGGSRKALSASGTVGDYGILSLVGDGIEISGTGYGIYQKTLSLTSLSGSYSIYEDARGRNIGNITVFEDGVVEGQTENGCQLDGKVSIPDTNFNSFEIEFDIGVCETGPFSRATGNGHVVNGVPTLIVNDWNRGYLWELRRH